MRYLWLVPVPLLLMAFFFGCTPPPEMLTMQEETPKPGSSEVAYYRNGVLGSEELDSQGKTGSRDVWRYYDRGVMIREDVDMNHDGAVDTIRKFNRKGVLIKLITDVNYDGSFDKVEEFDDKGQRLPPKNTAIPNLARSQAGRNPDRVRTQNGKPDENDAQAQAEEALARDQQSSSTTTTRSTRQQSGSRSVTAQELFGEEDNAGQSTPVAPSNVATPPASVPATNQEQDAVKIEEPVATPPASNEPGSIIRRINVPAAGGTAGSGSRTGIVPDAQLRHPSEGMEE